MEPISIPPILISLCALIFPYIKNLTSTLVKEVGKKTPEILDLIWGKVKEKMEESPETRNIPEELVASPDDETVKGAFQYHLKKILESDDEFAQYLGELVDKVSQPNATNLAINSGDGGLAQGDNSIAVGKGGIFIGGNVSKGNISNGT